VTPTDAPTRPGRGRSANPARPGRPGRSGRPASGRPPQASRPGVDPRIRTRRIAVERQRGRRRLYRLVLLVVVTAAVLGGWWLLHSRYLSARVVTAAATAHTPEAEIVAASGLTARTPMIDVDPGQVSARVDRLPWVGRTTVTRQWPDGVRIDVTERTPVAVVSVPARPATKATAAVPARWALVDRTGRVLTDLPSPPAGTVQVVAPVVPGPPGTTLGRIADPALTVAATLPKAFGAQVTTVAVGSHGDVTASLTSPVTVRFGNSTQLRQKYESVAAILAGATLSPGDIIDVSVPGSPTVGPS
jgi:cell division protein FtsQ